MSDNGQNVNNDLYDFFLKPAQAPARSDIEIINKLSTFIKERVRQDTN